MSILTRLCTSLRSLFKRDRKAKQHRKKHCLVTGFEPFAGADFNPAGALTKLLPAQLSNETAEVSIDTLVLPVCADDAWKLVRNAVSRRKPDFVILIGLAEGRKLLSLEERAVNQRHYSIPDNCGNTWQNQAIDPACPAALHTRVPLRELRAALKGKNVPCEISQSAGTFVCNDLYFHALRELGTDTPVVFIHVPMLHDYAASLASLTGRNELDNPERQLKLLSDAVSQIIESWAELD